MKLSFSGRAKEEHPLQNKQGDGARSDKFSGSSQPGVSYLTSSMKKYLQFVFDGLKAIWKSQQPRDLLSDLDPT